MSPSPEAALLPPANREPISVSQLNREARAMLEGSFPLVWVEGEISNLARPASGHYYFSLKDEFAQVRCAMFRLRNMVLPFRPENGGRVLVRGRLSLYEPRGDFQLIAEYMEEAGDGLLRRAFELLKQRLDAEGLFDPARKRPLPPHPRCVGVVTSPHGAAVRDIITVLRRRHPLTRVVVYPTLVQGADSARQIAAAIRTAGMRRECDVLIVGRGGGSLEDLQPFNDESVARAIHDSPIPVVSAVGHETDFTIADFVADLRAPTPSAAAELVSPDGAEWAARFVRVESRLRNLIQAELRFQRQRLQGVSTRLKHPGRRLQEIAQRVDELEQRLVSAQRAWLRHALMRAAEARARLLRHDPRFAIERYTARAGLAHRRLLSAIQERLAVAQRRTALAARTLDAVSPLSTLARGYAIVIKREDGTVVRRADELLPGDKVETRLGRGHLLCNVEEAISDET